MTRKRALDLLAFAILGWVAGIGAGILVLTAPKALVALLGIVIFGWALRRVLEMLWDDKMSRR